MQIRILDVNRSNQLFDIYYLQIAALSVTVVDAADSSALVMVDDAVILGTAVEVAVMSGTALEVADSSASTSL